MNTFYAILCFVGFISMESAAQVKPQRKVLMTLSEGEVLYNSEHYLPAQFSSDGYSTYITATEDGKNWLYFRGKRIPLDVEGYGNVGFWDIVSLRPELENGYVFVSYIWGEKDLVLANIGGKIFGPYEQLYLHPAPNGIDYGVIYYDNGWYTSLNGIVKGPFNEIPENLQSNEQKSFSENAYDTEINGDQENLYKNGELLIENIQGYAVSPSNKYLAYAKGNELIVQGTTTKQKLPSGSVLSKMAVNDAGQLLCEYRDSQGKAYVQTASKKWGPYSAVFWSEFDGNNVIVTYDINGRVYCSSGVKNLESIWFDRHPRTSGFTDPLESFDGKHIMQFSYDGLTIDGQFLAGILGIQKWYDPTLNAFLWTSLEDNNIVLYTYTLN